MRCNPRVFEEDTWFSLFKTINRKNCNIFSTCNLYLIFSVWHPFKSTLTYKVNKLLNVDHFYTPALLFRILFPHPSPATPPRFALFTPSTRHIALIMMKAPRHPPHLRVLLFSRHMPATTLSSCCKLPAISHTYTFRYHQSRIVNYRSSTHRIQHHAVF
jgi:hypothetical protein